MSSPSPYHSFDEKVKALNSKQREAVEATEGPVMVIAGPGTGKTEILSLRIAHIIREGLADPKDILCMTYTDAAATEMRHRLISYIGPEAYRIQVCTFHSFCNMVIQENPGVFQQARELEPINDIEKFKLLQKLIDSFPTDHPLKKFKGNMYSDWKRLEELFMTMKKENWSPEFILGQVEEYVGRMKASDEFIYKKRTGDFQKGDFNPSKFKKEVTDKMEPLLAAVAEYYHYNELLAEQGQYDYEDMLLWVNKAFSKNADLLANYQERFLYLLVDEFQDTNGIQIAILQKLVDHEWLERPNIFVVGDDDQAIYRFQGANIQNLIEFHERYQPQVIVLENNYRSSQLILDAARKVMHPVENSLMQSIFNQHKTLLASGRNAAHEQPVVIQASPTPIYENAEIFRRLKNWHEEKNVEKIAVLYTKHDLGRDLAQALKGAGIPYQTSKSIDILYEPLINDLLDLMTCIDQLGHGARNDDALLYRMLHLRYLKPKTADLQALILSYTAKERDDQTTLYGWMSDPDKLENIRLVDRGWLEEQASLFDRAITESHARTTISFMEWILHEFGIMSWILHQPEKFIYMYMIKAFYQFIQTQSSGQANFTIQDLLEICKLMTTYNIRLPVLELAHPDKHIHLSSLHGAKGLEFNTVIIKNLVETEWEKKRKVNKSFSFPDNLVRQNSLSHSMEAGMDTDDQDRRRLLYVGMTRAERELILSYAQGREDGKPQTPSLYLTEIGDQNSAIEQQKLVTDENIQFEYLNALISGELTADLDKDNAEIRERVKHYVFNVSALNAYLECPVQFYYQKIISIPAPEVPPMVFGKCLHAALELFFRKRFLEKDTGKGKAFLLDMFELKLRQNAHLFTQKEYNDLMIYGHQCLESYYEEYHNSWSEDVQYAPEYKIRDIHIHGIPVTGFIDRVDRLGDTITVYDYKSGRPDNIANKSKRPNEKDIVGGDYWRQMVFYDLLLRADPRINHGITTGYVHSLEEKKEGGFVSRQINVTAEDREIVIQQLTETYEKVQRMEFEKGCGECAWCRMHDLRPPLPGEEDFSDSE